MVDGRRPLGMPFASAQTLVWASPMDFICFSSAECVRKFFSCFEFEEMPLQEGLLMKILVLSCFFVCCFF